MKKDVISWIKPTELEENSIANELYADNPENYEEIKETISKYGVISPIIVQNNKVKSGNLRLKIAKELKIDKVPVIDTQFKEELDEELMVVLYNKQRIKTHSEILKEYKLLEKKYPLGKGSRTDLNPKLKKNAEKLKALNVSKTRIQLLKRVDNLAKDLYGVNSEKYKNIWDEIDLNKISLNRVEKKLTIEKVNKENSNVLPGNFDLITNNAKVFNKSCETMSEIEDATISCIITSPPYFNMLDYGTGPNQRGMERNIEDYINGLIKDLKDCKRVIKQNGSLWINLNEPVVNGQYYSICHQFVIGMRKEGWILNDEIIWIKNNPQFTQAKRAVRSHEYIFHFVKSKEYLYDISWLKDLTNKDEFNLISLGTSGKISNLISGMDINGSVIRTNANNMNKLRKSCKKNGFNLTHKGGFPVSIPLIAILTSSKVGDSVLDVYSGTGTSGEVALRTQRNYIGYEIKSEFVKASAVRMEPFLENQFDNNIAA